VLAAVRHIITALGFTHWKAEASRKVMGRPAAWGAGLAASVCAGGVEVPMRQAR